MILVRNHRLPSNGSNLLLGLAIIILFLSGCKPRFATPTPRTGPTESVDRTGKETKEVEVEVTDAELSKELVTDNTIALLLPFQLDKVSHAEPNTEDIKRSALALDFYQGFKLGLDELARNGTDFRVHVLDTRDNAAETSRLSSLTEVSAAALIVGPVFPQEIRAFKGNINAHTVQISPLAASQPSEFNNPNLVTITPPLTTHIDVLAAHIIKRYSAGDEIIFFDSPDNTSKQFLTPLRTALRRLKGGLQVLEISDPEELLDVLKISNANFVVCGTTNKYQITSLLDRLNAYRQDLSLDIRLYGHPNWDKISFDASDGLSLFETRITSSYYVDKQATAVRAFDDTYQTTFGVSATEFSYKGYDAARYFGQLLAKYGLSYKDHITKENYDGLHNSFEFVYDPASGFVNGHVEILQYRNGSFRRSN